MMINLSIEEIKLLNKISKYLSSELSDKEPEMSIEAYNFLELWNTFQDDNVFDAFYKIFEKLPWINNEQIEVNSYLKTYMDNKNTIQHTVFFFRNNEILLQSISLKEDKINKVYVEIKDKEGDLHV